MSKEAWEPLHKAIEKEYGDDVLITGEQATSEERMLIPFSPSIDFIIGGGIEEGSVVGITGKPKHYKTGTILSFAAVCQRPEYGSRPVYYFKVEGRLPLPILKGTKGLDLSEGRFSIIQSRKGRVLSAEDHLRIALSVLKTVPGAVVVLDSISSLCEERELAGEIGVETRGGRAKLMGQFCRIAGQIVPINRSILLGVTHIMANTTGYGPHQREQGGFKWEYQRDYVLRVTGKKDWVAGDRVIGAEVEWVCDTSKRCPPGGKMSSYLRFGTGVDRAYEAIHMAESVGKIRRSKAWYYPSFLVAAGLADENVKFQGAEKLYRALLDNPEWERALMACVAEFSSIQGADE